MAELKKQIFETETINAYDYAITPRNHCNHECFAQSLRGKNEECPIHDDVSTIYSRMKEADILALGVPTYGSKPSSLYSAFSERTQGNVKNYDEFKTTILNKIMALTVIGNVPASGDPAYHTVISDQRDCKYPPSAPLLQATGYQQGSLQAILAENRKVRDRLDNFGNSILKD